MKICLLRCYFPVLCFPLLDMKHTLVYIKANVA
jgi:hypothetical protein